MGGAIIKRTRTIVGFESSLRFLFINLSPANPSWGMRCKHFSHFLLCLSVLIDDCLFRPECNDIPEDSKTQRSGLERKGSTYQISSVYNDSVPKYWPCRDRCGSYILLFYFLNSKQIPPRAQPHRRLANCMNLGSSNGICSSCINAGLFVIQESDRAFSKPT